MVLFRRWFYVLAVTAALFLLSAGVSAEWWSFDFQPGQHLTYEMSWEQHGVERVGLLEIRVQDSTDGFLHIIMFGEFDEQEPFAFAAEVDPDDPDDIFFQVILNLMTEVPEEVGELIFGTVWLPWFDLPMHGDTLDADWGFYEEEEDGTVFSLSVIGQELYAGLEGTIVRIEAEADLGATMDLAINYGIPLPIMVSVFDIQEWHELGAELAGATLTVTLQDFAADVPPLAEVPAGNVMWQQARPTGVLAELLDHFEAHGLYVELTMPNNYEQLGAADGLWVEIAGDDIELFWFDRAQADEETLEALATAKATGEFHYGPADMRMRQTGVVQGDIFMSGLQFHDVYVHPYKDEIEAAFSTFAQ